MDGAIALLNFGEPSEPTREEVVPYLARIFRNNADLEEADTEAEVRERSRELAERRVTLLADSGEDVADVTPHGFDASVALEERAPTVRAEVGHGFRFEVHRGTRAARRENRSP